MDEIARAAHPPAEEGTDAEEPLEAGEITLVPLERIGARDSIQPRVTQARIALKALVGQGMPGINATYVHRVVTFIEESASNVRDHAHGDDVTWCEGFVAADRTRTRYLDRRRTECVTVYTTYLSCCDTGRGILPSLAGVPALAGRLGTVPPWAMPLAALELAAEPGITNRPDEDGRGGGLPQLIELVHSLATAGEGASYLYRGGLRLTSGGAELVALTTTRASSQDRLLPGTQLQLKFEAIGRAPAA